MTTGMQNKEMEDVRLSTATLVRRKITPFLPPPVISVMNQMDPALEPMLGPDGSVTVAGTLLLALFLWKLVSLVMGSSSSQSRGAIQDDKEDDAIPEMDEVPYDGTAVFCGPCLGGKTSILYALIYPDKNHNVQTVSSIKPNTGFRNYWRLLDIPGSWSPDKLLSMVKNSERVILVLDSSQPVSKAVDYLYEILKKYDKVVVACHKSKHPKAKNVRRLKLQVRKELERLENLDASVANASIDWDDVLAQKVGFISTSVDPLELTELETYLETGALPSST